MNKFLGLSPKDKIQILQATGEHVNLPAYAVEKDWWVVQTLSILFELPIGQHLVFKGGTSLSKAWELIERFSEDIDLALDRSFLGFEGDLSRSQRTKLRKAANSYITGNLFKELEKAFEAKGLTGVKIELEEITSSDQDPVVISIYYEQLIESPGHIQPRVQVEIGCQSLIEPQESRSINSFIDQVYPGSVFFQELIQVPSVLPTRIFLEKLYLLHEEFQKPKEKMRVNRLSRHLYDIYQLSNAEFGPNALADEELYAIIVKHRFTKIGGIDYGLHQPQTLNPIPPQEVIEAWENDYKTMQEEMIHGASPNFKELVLHIENLKAKINKSAWSINF